MDKKKFMLAILLISIVCLGSSVVFAEDADSIQDSDILAVDNNDVLLSSNHTVSSGATNDEIQNTINGMDEGDTLNFENGTYSDICIYVNKSITINGNGATLIGYDTPSTNNTPSIITNTTANGGYGISNLATFYVVKANNVIINGLNIVGGANSASAYSNAVVFVTQSQNLTFTNNKIDGSSWGIYLQSSPDAKITDNMIQNQAVTGLISFGSARAQIERNKVVNAKNHGIDVRHGTGPNVQVINNTVIGSQEGIYLMHSQGHTAAYNTIINCTISSISCYGSSNVLLVNNTLQKSRIGVLLGGGYKNITVGTNTFKLDNLPYPPTFVYYIAEGQSEYQSATAIMGTHSDSSSYTPTFTEYKEIPIPKNINIDYTTILSETGTVYNVPEGTSSADIQKIIDSMKDGDTLKFAKDAVYNDISIYIEKNIKIMGNGATLVGYDNVNLTNVPSKITATTANGGYGLSNPAVLYSVNNTGAVISNLNIVSKYPGYKLLTDVPATSIEYKTAGIRTWESKNITITDCTVDGASWGIYLEYSGNAIVTNNNIKNQYTTGILNFGTPQSIIAGNTITDAINHGIDVRHGTGPRVTVFNNTVTGAKEGIYLMHSQGHNVYNNTVSDCSLSGITAYGSGNENIFNNSISGSRIGILLGGGYYNVTIGANTYDLDFLPFPPTFVTYLAKAESKYFGAAEGTYGDTFDTIISVDDVTTGKNATIEFTLTTAVKKTPLANQTVTAIINNETYTAVTDENGTGKINATLDYGIYDVSYTYAGENQYINTVAASKLFVGEDIVTIISFTEVTGDKNITGVLKDVEGNVMANANLTCIVGDTNVTITTDENGIFTIQEAEGAVTVIYDGSAPWLATNATITLKDMVPARAVTLIKGENYTQNTIEYKAGERGGNFTVQLVDANGNVLANKTVLIGYNGKMLERTTDENGFASVQINLVSENRLTFAVTFLGDENYNATMSVYLITITKKPVTITAKAQTFKKSAKSKKCTVTLSTVPGADGKVVFTAGKKVTLKVNGKTYTAKTKANGQATFNLKLTKKGKFTGKVSYAGDSTYAAASQSVKITIK